MWGVVKSPILMIMIAGIFIAGISKDFHKSWTKMILYLSFLDFVVSFPLAWPPSHLDCSVMSWHYVGTTWISTKYQHCWNCVPLTPVTLCWHFPLATDVSKRFIERDCFNTHCCCREQPFCALWRHRLESTRFHVDVFRVFHIDFQAS